MRSPTTLVIGSAALVLSGCAVGLLLGRWLGPLPPAVEPADAVALQPDLSPLLAELVKLNESILSVQRDRTDAPPTSERFREPVSSKTTDQLAAAIERLSDLLERSNALVAARSDAMEAIKGPGFLSIEALWQVADTRRGTQRDGWMGEFDRELTAAHLAWLRDDVFQRYGKPTYMFPGPDGAALWLIYEQDPDPDAEESSSIRFSVSEGLVTLVSYTH